MADRLARPMLHRNRTSEGSFQAENMRESRARHSTRDSRRQRSTSTRTSSPEGPLFACPYSKHDPDRYSHKNVAEQDYRNCSSGYWTSIPRLKQHLYRTHDRSERCCPRCWVKFPNDESLRRHIDTADCVHRDMPEEKMDEETQQRIRERIQGRPLESWYSIYRILFPGDDLPPSPLAEWVVGDDLRSCFEMLAQALPNLLFRAAVQSELVSGSTQPNRHTRFPTTAGVIRQALLHCQREFGQATGLGHIFRTEAPSFTENTRGPPTVSSQSSSPSQSRHSRSVSEADEYEAQIQALAIQRGYVSPGGGAQQMQTNVPYTSVGYHPATMAPMDEGLYEAYNVPGEMYDEYGLPEEDY